MLAEFKIKNNHELFREILTCCHRTFLAFVKEQNIQTDEAFDDDCVFEICFDNTALLISGLDFDFDKLANAIEFKEPIDFENNEDKCLYTIFNLVETKTEVLIKQLPKEGVSVQ